MAANSGTSGKEADRLGNQKIGTSHLSLAFLREGGELETPILTVLNKNGIRLDSFCDEIARSLSEGLL
jgi:hypothetical protein